MSRLRAWLMVACVALGLTACGGGDAAERMNRGAAKRHRERILDLVYAHPGCTSKELTRFLTQEDAEDGIDRVELGRRLPELEAANEIYRTSEGRQDMRCWPGERPK